MAKVFLHVYDGSTLWLPTRPATPAEQADPRQVIVLPHVTPDELTASVYLLPYPVRTPPDADEVNRAIADFRASMGRDADFLSKRKFGGPNPFRASAPPAPQHHGAQYAPQDQHHYAHQGHSPHQPYPQQPGYPPQGAYPATGYGQHQQSHQHQHHQGYPQQQGYPQHHGYPQHVPPPQQHVPPPQQHAPPQQQQHHTTPPPAANGREASNPYNLPSYPLPPVSQAAAAAPPAQSAKVSYLRNAPPDIIPDDAIKECDPVEPEITVEPDRETVESFTTGAKSKVYVATLPRTRRVAWLRDYAVTVSQNQRYVSLGGGLTVVMNADARDLTHSKPIRLVERQLCVYFMQHGFCGRPTCQNTHHSEKQVKKLIAARHAELKKMSKEERQKISDDLVLEEVDEVEAEAAKEGLLAGPTRSHLRPVERPKAKLDKALSLKASGGKSETSSSSEDSDDSSSSDSSASSTEKRRRKKEKKRREEKSRRKRLAKRYGQMTENDYRETDRRKEQRDSREPRRESDHDRRRDEYRRDDYRRDDRERRRPRDDRRDPDRHDRRHRGEPYY